MKLPAYNQRLLTIEKRTQRFMLGAIVVLLAALAMIAVKQNYFHRSTPILFFTPNAQGLSKGMAVKFIGFKVGAVEDVSMQPNATVQVLVSLDNEYVHLIGQDAKARLVKEALVGESVVEIIPGSQQVRQVTRNSVLEFERGQDASSVVEDLAGQLNPILNDVRTITHTLSDPNGDAQQALKNMNQATRALNDTLNQYTALGANVNRKLDKTMTSVDSTLDALDKSVPKLLDKVDATLDGMQSATADIKKITQESAEIVPPLIRNSNALIEDGQDAMNGVKKSWLLKGLFAKPEEQTLPLDGYVPPKQP